MRRPKPRSRINLNFAIGMGKDHWRAAVWKANLCLPAVIQRDHRFGHRRARLTDGASTNDNAQRIAILLKIYSTRVRHAFGWNSVAESDLGVRALFSRDRLDRGLRIYRSHPGSCACRNRDSEQGHDRPCPPVMREMQGRGSFHSASCSNTKPHPIMPRHSWASVGYAEVRGGACERAGCQISNSAG